MHDELTFSTILFDECSVTTLYVTPLMVCPLKGAQAFVANMADAA